ncbi:MAG: FKBP-type peptidyl-prolyl cis-trans isomerase [Pontibacterium sp.]
MLLVVKQFVLLCQQKCLLVLGLILCTVLTSACSESDDKQAFRDALVEKALNDETYQQGEAFLAEYIQQPDALRLPSGVLYRVIASGSKDSPSPRLADTVVVKYEGKLVNGSVFDRRLDTPIKFPVAGVVKGWQHALFAMHVGDVWEVVVPSKLAYGAKSPSREIPANSVLIFSIELLEVIER